MPYLPVIVACLGFLLVLSVVWTTLRVGISPMPSSRRAVSAMINLIPNDIPGPVLDLGSGLGSLTRAVARHRQELVVTGYELSPLPLLWARLISRLGHSTSTYLRRDFFVEDLTSARIVLCYLYPGAMSRISETPEMFSPGTVLISNTFRVPGWTPDEVVELDDLYRTRVYRYIVGAKVDDHINLKG